MMRRLLGLFRDAYRYAIFGSPRAIGGFRGAFEDFEQAKAAAPGGSRLGYDHEDLALEFRADLDLRIEICDYPLLFHVRRIETECSTVLDFGGNVGIHYLRYRSRANLESTKWIVLDVPEITKAGRHACSDLANVSFVNSVSEIEAPRLDLFFSSGSMQYVESASAVLQQLIDLGLRPRHILIGSVPLHEGKRFVTLQNGGLVYYPQYVFNRDEYIGAIEALGYDLVDIWNDRVSTCKIPFHREKSVPAFAGLCFSERGHQQGRLTSAQAPLPA